MEDKKIRIKVQDYIVVELVLFGSEETGYTNGQVYVYNFPENYNKEYDVLLTDVTFDLANTLILEEKRELSGKIKNNKPEIRIFNILKPYMGEINTTRRIIDNLLEDE